MFKFKKQYIPNTISAFRIALVPVYVLLFFGIVPAWDPMISSGVVFVIAGASDLVDGYLARRNHWITDLGKLLDPLADKLMELAVTVSLAIRFGGAFLILAAITVLKEAVMIVGAFIIMRRGRIAVFSNWYGKAATLAWFITVFLVSFVPGVQASAWCHVLCILLIVVMAFAFVMYVIQFQPAIQKTLREIRKSGSGASIGEAEESK